MIALLALLVGCDLLKLPADPWVGDLDGDGFDTWTDCDDLDARVHPGAEEECDGLDQDCDGTEDDAIDASTWFEDLDGDGWGDAGTLTWACETPLGMVPDAGDCDDGDATWYPGAPEDGCATGEDRNCDGSVGWADMDGDGVPACQDCNDGDALAFPGADERCNGLDDDCDGELDEDAALLTWHGDWDGDGWGAPDVTTESCSRPPGFVLDARDCDDLDAAVHPDAAEACDALDNDCDGQTDEYDWVGNDKWYADDDGDGYGRDETALASCAAVAGRVDAGGDCDDNDASLSPATSWHFDSDRDGYGRATVDYVQCDPPGDYYMRTGDDCDDRRSAVFPGAQEVCNSRDDDCDGTVDDAGTGGPTWYPDADGDGFGDGDAGVSSCTQPAGWLSTGTDCDDANAAAYPDAPETDCADPVDYNCDGSAGLDDGDGDGWVACLDCDDADGARSPGADERCDGIENDCDGTTDEDDAVDAFTWYADADRDTYGDGQTARTSCSIPSGYVMDDADCDDTQRAVNPSATESCATAYDDDCDGLLDALDATGCTDWFADADGDGWGDDPGVCRCEAPDGYALSVGGDCDPADPAISPGATEVCGTGVDEDCDGDGGSCGFAMDQALADLPDRVVGASTSDYLGYSVAAPGDVDGDGLADLLVGAVGADPTAGAGAGAAFLFLGRLEGELTEADAWATFEGVAASDQAGNAVALAGDTDGDGVAELLIGARGASGWDGAVYLLPATTTGTVSLGVGATWTGAGSERAGWSVAGLGDVDGDGLDDAIVGAPEETAASAGAGAAYLLFGPADADGALADAGAVLIGDAAAGELGQAVAAAGDVDGDGLADVLAAAPDADGARGSAYLFVGAPVGSVPVADAAARFDGAATNDQAGRALAGGDLDGDGYADVVVGACGTDGVGRDAGRVGVWFGPSPAGGSLALADVAVDGGAAEDAVGMVVALGDVNDDGQIDLVASGQRGAADPAGGWVFLGPLAAGLTVDDADASFVGGGDEAGEAMAVLGDTDGGGYGDLAVGAYLYDAGTYGDAGAVFLAYGGPGM